MNITEIYYLERVKTADFAFKEIKMSANLEANEVAIDAVAKLELMVKSQLSGQKVVHVATRETAPQTATPTNNTPSEKVETPSTVGQTSGNNDGSEKVAIIGAIEKAKALGGVEKLNGTLPQLKKIADHLELTYKSKDTKAMLTDAINGDLGFLKAVDPTNNVVTPEVVAPVMNDVQMACRDLAVHTKDPAKVVAMLTKYGASSVATLPVAQYAPLITEIRKVIAG